MKISIIIPYNEDRGFLKEAIASAEAQTFKDFEIIKQFGKFNVSKNLNDGLKKAKGKYIKILAEDDLLLPNCLEDLHKGIQGYDFVNANSQNFGINPMWYGDEEYHESEHIGKFTNFAEMLFRNQLHQLTILYKKSILFDVGGFDEKLTTGEDYDMSLLLLKRGYKLGYVNKFVGRYRIHEINKSIALPSEEFHERKRKIKKLMQERYG
ncbi:MAG TPA: glycosyltransferase [bacterium]|nr:glycosyltransferase [bacterium]